LLLHAGVAFALVSVEPEPVHEATTVTVVEVKKPKTDKAKPEPEPPPPPPIVQKTVPVRKAAPAPPAPAPVEAPAPVADAPSEAASAAPAPMLGLTLSGGVGVGTGGVAVPLGNSLGAPQAPRVTRTAQPKALIAKKDRAEGDLPSDTECLEALVKPKPIAIPQPTYADRAREAGVQGKVRVELTVDESGTVIETRVLEGLGYGLDEAALEAAKAARFEPALRCGKPTRTTFVIGIRFAL